MKQSVVIIHFYGYQKGVNVNLNNGSAARQLLELKYVIYMIVLIAVIYFEDEF